VKGGRTGLGQHLGQHSSSHRVASDCHTQMVVCAVCYEIRNHMGHSRWTEAQEEPASEEWGDVSAAGHLVAAADPP
jgi:hypothetical protein